MPSSERASKVPSYRRHKPTGQAVVTLNGKDFYLGRYGTKASQRAYDRLTGEWMACGRCLPKQVEADTGPSIAELCVAYWNHAKVYYRKNGQLSGSTARVKAAIRAIREHYAQTPAADFGPLALQAVRQRFIERGCSRGYINHVVGVIKQIFRWGASQQLLPVETYQALATVAGLQAGRTAAPEPAPIGPIDDAVVDATLPHMPEIVADMVRLQRLTGCRPAEVCIVRPCDVDTAGDVWVYRPESHKTEHHGRERAICLGPKAQDILRPYLLRDKTAYCFSPAESERRRRAQVHAVRKTPLSCGNRPGTNRKSRPKKKPRNRYDTISYRQAIQRAADMANRERKAKDQLPRWAPNRLRHTAATQIRHTFGLEAAQVALGHSQADVTQIYAEKNLTLAAEVARKIG